VQPTAQDLNDIGTENQMPKNRFVLAALALSIAVTGGLAAAAPAQASSVKQSSATQVVSTAVSVTIHPVAPDDSCWD
jgi:hypothetical protein